MAVAQGRIQRLLTGLDDTLGMTRKRQCFLRTACLAGVLIAGVVGIGGGARTVTFLAVAAMHVCKPFRLLNLIAPAAGIVQASDIVYAPGPRHSLDVYAPAGAASRAPVVVFFYGGGWETGEKSTYRFVGANLAEHGMVVVIPDYRLYPAVRFPAFEQDAAAAVAWVKANIARYGGDPHRLFLMGHSAGAQIAALLALDPEYLRAEALSRRDVCGVIGLAGPYDFHPATRTERAIFGASMGWGQPIAFAQSGAPPMLLLAGLSDRTVDPGSTLRFAARLNAGGGSARGRLYPGISHTGIVASIANPLSFLAPVTAATVRFIRGIGGCGAARVSANAP